MPVILATQEAEIRRNIVRGQPGQEELRKSKAYYFGEEYTVVIPQETQNNGIK
jgi:hypothetical protein